MDSRRAKRPKSPGRALGSTSPEARRARAAALAGAEQQAELLEYGGAFLSAVLDTIANLIVVLDRDGNIVRVNKACERATGYAASELVGKPVFDLLIPADELAGTRETFRQLRAGNFPNHHENRWRRKDGAERLIEWENTAIPDARGDVRFVIATGVDVTDRRREQETLRRREEDLRLAEDAARMGSWDWDLVTNRLVWSARCRELFELPPQGEMTYDLFEASLHPEDRPRVEAKVQAALAGAGDYEAEMRVPLPGGGVRWIASLGRAFFDERGVPVRMAGMALDITERKRAEEALSRANEQLVDADRRKTDSWASSPTSCGTPSRPSGTAPTSSRRSRPAARRRRARAR